MCSTTLRRNNYSKGEHSQRSDSEKGCQVEPQFWEAYNVYPLTAVQSKRSPRSAEWITERSMVLLAVRRRRLIGILQKPRSAQRWGECSLERQSVRLGWICADGLKAWKDVIAEVFPKRQLQRCSGRISQRNIISDVTHRDKREVAEDLKQGVSRTGDRNSPLRKSLDGVEIIPATNGEVITGQSRQLVRLLLHSCNLHIPETMKPSHHGHDLHDNG